MRAQEVSKSKKKKYEVEAAKLKEEYQALREKYEASTKYRKWKKAVKEWNEVHREEWQEQVRPRPLSHCMHCPF